MFIFSYQSALRSASTSEGVRVPLQGPLGSIQKIVRTENPQWVGGAGGNVLRLQNTQWWMKGVSGSLGY